MSGVFAGRSSREKVAEEVIKWRVARQGARDREIE